MRRARRTAALLTAAALGAGLVSLAGPTAGAGPRGGVTSARLIPATAGAVLPQRNAEASSLNWSGYAVVPARRKVTGVRTTFRVPAAGVVPPGFASTWAGIGGYDSGDLIQAGAAEQSTGLGGPRYYAWVETLPDPARPLASCTGDKRCTVTPGDVMTVDIHETTTNVWSVTVTNRKHWTWHGTIPYTSSHSSAEWILEAPQIGGVQSAIAPVGRAYFGRRNTWTAGGVTRSIAAGKPVKVYLSPGLVSIAQPSDLAANGQSFNACAYRLSCPTPAR